MFYDFFKPLFRLNMLLSLLITALNFSSGQLMEYFQFSSTFFYQNMVLGSVVLKNAQVGNNLYRKNRTQTLNISFSTHIWSRVAEMMVCKQILFGIILLP